MNNHALEALGLRKAFGGLTVTRDVSLSLPQGARHALIGPNGAGKSTLVGLLSGILRLDAGTIRVNGRDVSRKSPPHRVREGLVRSFQVSNLFGGLTVLENVFLAVSEHFGASYRMWRSASRECRMIERAEAIVDRVGLTRCRGQRVDGLAYGQKRLLEIAIALALEPKVLLLDEPTAGIPSAEAGRLLDSLDQLPEDIAILLIEHDMQVVKRFASQVTVMVEGRILITGAPPEVMASEAVKSVYLGASGERRFQMENLNA